MSTLVEENKDITTASILEWNTDTYHCHLSDKIPTRHNHFVRMFIPVDGNARRGVMSSENMTWGIYFGRILLFFLCEINGQTFTMCLVSIDPTTKPFPGTGIPTGSVFADDRKTFKKVKLYVTDIKYLENPVAVIPSSRHLSKGYYVWSDMQVPQEI